MKKIVTKGREKMATVQEKGLLWVKGSSGYSVTSGREEDPTAPPPPGGGE